MIKIKKIILIILILLITNISSSEVHLLTMPKEKIFDNESAYELERIEKELKRLNKRYEKYLDYKDWLKNKINYLKIDLSFSYNSSKAEELQEKEKEFRILQELYPQMLKKIKAKCDEAQNKYDKLLAVSRNKFRNLRLASLENNSEEANSYEEPPALILSKNKKFSW